MMHHLLSVFWQGDNGKRLLRTQRNRKKTSSSTIALDWLDRLQRSQSIGSRLLRLGSLDGVSNAEIAKETEHVSAIKSVSRRSNVQKKRLDLCNFHVDFPTGHRP
jgi:hypothetical protein